MLNGAPSNLTPNQFGDPQLSPAEAYAACGPAAAVAFARANGRNPTLREATDLAKTVGWSTSLGMAGPQSEVALLQKMGVPTRLENGVNWANVQADVGAGNPVIIDTPNHYWVVSGYDPGSGRYYVGNSGTAYRAGAEWMTTAQIEAIGGAARSALYIDHTPNDGPSVAAPGAPGGGKHPGLAEPLPDVPGGAMPPPTASTDDTYNLAAGGPLAGMPRPGATATPASPGTTPYGPMQPPGIGSESLNGIDFTPSGEGGPTPPVTGAPGQPTGGTARYMDMVPKLSVAQLTTDEGYTHYINDLLNVQNIMIAGLDPNVDAGTIAGIRQMTQERIQLAGGLYTKIQVDGKEKVQQEYNAAKLELDRQIANRADARAAAANALGQGQLDLAGQRFSWEVKRAVIDDFYKANADAIATGTFNMNALKFVNDVAYQANQQRLAEEGNDLSRYNAGESGAYHQAQLGDAFSGAQITSAKTLSDAQAQNARDIASAASNAIPAGMAFVPGFEPGGAMEHIAGLLGNSYTPWRTDSLPMVNIGGNVGPLAQSLAAALMGHPGNPANPDRYQPAPLPAPPPPVDLSTLPTPPQLPPPQYPPGWTPPVGPPPFNPYGS